MRLLGISRRLLGQWTAALFVAVAASVLATPALCQDEEDPEIKLGREAAAEHDKQAKFITDPAIVDRVTRIGNELAEIANRATLPIHWGRPGLKKLPYTFKVIDDKDVNAYTLPGGFIYVNKGLLEFATSDDELAGVLAHEIIHAKHHHMMKLLAEQEKIQLATLAPVLLSVVLGKGGGQATENLLLAGQLYTLAKINTYGIEAEKDSDQGAAYLMKESRYNPVGLLTFMERLARTERFKPQMELGIYRTHPPTLERAQALISLLTSMGIPIRRREVDPSLAARVELTAGDTGHYADVTMMGTRIVRLAGSDAAALEQRARKIAETLNRLFDEDLLAFDVTLSSDKTRVLARRRTLIAVTEDDARATGKTVAETAQQAFDAIRSLIWQDQFNRTPLPLASSRS